MAHITRNELGEQHIRLDITLSPEDYISKFEKEIKALTRNAQVKGFRPGKTPPSMVKRMYGSNVLLDTVQDILLKELNAYLEDTKPNILGHPVVSEKQPDNKMSLTHPGDITFSYEMGLRPELNFDEIEAMRFDRYQIVVPDSMIDETVEKIRASYKVNTDLTEGIIETGDSFKVDFKEVAGLFAGETTLSLKFIKEDEEPHFIGKKPGDTLIVNLFDLEKNSDEKSVRKYILGLDDDDDRIVSNMFELTIKSIVRTMPGTVSEEMFNSVFPGRNITDELTFREVLRTELSNSDSLAVNRLLTNDILDKIKEKVTLPDSFMKHWIVSQDENPNRAKAAIETQYPMMAETMKREIATGDLIEHFKLQISEAEVIDFIDRYYGIQYGMQQLGPELSKLVYDKMKKEDTSELRGYTQTLAEAKIGNYFYEKGLTTPIPISAEELDAKWKKFVGREDALKYLADEEHDHSHDHHDHEHPNLFQEIEETPIEVIE